MAIVGPGRLGQAMGKLLWQAGVPIKFVAARELARARNAVRFIGGGKALSLKDRRLADADIILITTSDTALNPVARELAGYREDWSGRIALHTCGSVPACVLDPFRNRGASIGALHPYQTIPNPSAGVRNLRGGFWAVEGDRRAVAVARRWVKMFSGTTFELQPDAKPIYHLSAFLVCPTVVTLMDCSERLLQQAGVPRRVIRPMLGRFVSETVNNFVEFGARKALTGPAVRGDWTTLEKHVAELQRFAPEVIPAYIELLNLMLRVAGASPDRSKRARRAISSGLRAAARPQRNTPK
ncbi:MAG: DUF2520 domain-containing protein [Acidobacteria bacterium]|nr:DUF2520 domain-containing protein [Acidobacteriota bacterium]